MFPIPPVLFRFVLLALALVSVSACSTPEVDLAAWRARQPASRPEARRGSLASETAQVDGLRSEGKLATARELALLLVAEHPENPELLYRASVSESDGVLVFPVSDTDARNHALASSLNFVESAVAHGANDATTRAQLAWALGTTTHLQPMGERSDRARHTRKVAEGVLAEDPTQARALATLAVLNLRLQTLPWIADLMASDLPESSLRDAESFARRAVELRPSRENISILAKVLDEAEKDEEARELLEGALARPPLFPRDWAMEGSLREQLEDD